MKYILYLIAITAALSTLCTSCVEHPKKNPKYNENIATYKSEHQYDSHDVTEKIPEIVVEEQPKEEAKTETETETVIDTHVYTGEEITDELIKEKLIGYWEFDDFGYLGGYRFFESGFLQLVLERKVNQTGIFMVKYGGIYFSLDSKTWDEDVLIVKSVSDTEIIGTFGDNELTIRRADETLVEENSGYSAEGGSGSGSIVDASLEVEQGVRA